jgi:AcrR family transcriptional regulator
VTGVYGGVDAADRRADRRERLLQAALDLVGTEGWQACTVRAICARANLTSRYFYESFTDRDALLLALFDQIVEQSAIAVLAAVAGAPDEARAKAHAAIEAFVELVTEDPRKVRVLFVEAMGSEALTRRRAQTVRSFAEIVAEQARVFYRMREASDPLVQMTAVMLVGGLTETLLAWLDGTVRMSREELIDTCTDLFVATGERASALVRARSATR